MQENQYSITTGNSSDTRGFDDCSPAGRFFAQSGWNPMTAGEADRRRHLPYASTLTGARWSPANASTTRPAGSACTIRGIMVNDLRRSRSVRVRQNVHITMGFYTRRIPPIHYLPADMFTVCDTACSLLGGTTEVRALRAPGSTPTALTAGRC